MGSLPRSAVEGESRPDALESGCEIALDVFAAQTDEVQIAAFQFGLANRVHLLASGVHRAVDLDDESRGRGEEVDDVAVDRLLTLEAHAVETAIAECLP